MAKKDLFTGKNIAILGGAGLIAYFLFSKPVSAISGGGGASVFESFRELGGGVKDVFQSSKEFISKTAGLLGTGAEAVGTGVGIGGDIIGATKKEVKTIGEGLTDLRQDIPKIIEATEPISKGLLTGISPIHAFIETKKAIPKVVPRVKKAVKVYTAPVSLKPVSLFKRVATLGWLT